MEQGTIHPITQFLRKAVSVFKGMGFEVLESPEITTEKHNFDDLLIPHDHPARQMQDTFWLTDETGHQGGNRRLPRTHTSAYQIPAMAKRKPPVRLLIPGRVFRNEATDATHEITFYQLEGFVIDKTTSLAHLKGTLEAFVKQMYGSDVEIKFVPAYFPFVEPGLEVYVATKHGWLELLGAGMIHPGVLKNMGVTAGHQGFAFGLGIDRLVALAWEIDDIRYFYSGNLRFLTQFRKKVE